MFMNALVIFYLLSFILLSWFRFRLAVIFFIILLPAYLVRFNIGPLPSTALEFSFGALGLVWILKYARDDFRNIIEFVRFHKLLAIFIALFFVASVIGIFISDMWWYSTGQWRAYFLEPMILFFILIGRRGKIRPRDLAWALALSTASISVYSIIQEFTGWGIATSEWTNEASRRVTAFFTSPNAVGLYLGPLIPVMAAYVVVSRARLSNQSPENKSDEKAWKIYSVVVLAVLSLAALFFSFSQGAWIAVGVGVAIFLFSIGWVYRKIAIGLVVAGIVAALIIPSIRTAVLFQDKASQNRIMLWKYSWEYLKTSPKNFIFGTGIRQFFRKIQKPHYNPAEMERLIYPHNIFLNFWTEIGLLGAISFFAMLGYAFYASYAVARTNKALGGGLISALAVISIHGLVDVPYFKNDLAMLFWILMAIIFLLYENQRQSKAVIGQRAGRKN